VYKFEVLIKLGCPEEGIDLSKYSIGNAINEKL